MGEPVPFEHKGVRLYLADALDLLPQLAEESVDAIVTDPPYGLGFMGKEWDSGKSFVERKAQRSNTFDHVGGNHNPVDSADAARTRRVEAGRYGQWCELWAAECLRVLKPGGHLLAFGGTRTWHRLACAVEDAGFEIRDTISWLYGSGFPKSLDVSKAIDKAAGAQREVIGPSARHVSGKLEQRTEGLTGSSTFAETIGMGAFVTAPATDDARRWSGWGTALKPAHEPIVVARKPLSGTVASNVLAHGTGALNIDACRVEGEVPSVPQWSSAGSNNNWAAEGRNGEMSKPHDAGRWPSNVVLDEAAAAELDRQSGITRAGERPANRAGVGYHGNGSGTTGEREVLDSGGASRFFPTFKYQAKAPAKERPKVDGVAHPTVKPLELMRWLVRLVTPAGGVVLDPFAGSGTTAEACILEGFACVTVDNEPTHLPLIFERLNRAERPS